MKINNKVSRKHRLGNWIFGFFQIIDGLIMVFTLGYVISEFGLSWTCYRASNNFLCDKINL